MESKEEKKYDYLDDPKYKENRKRRLRILFPHT